MEIVGVRGWGFFFRGDGLMERDRGSQRVRRTEDERERESAFEEKKNRDWDGKVKKGCSGRKGFGRNG